MVPMYVKLFHKDIKRVIFLRFLNYLMSLHVVRTWPPRLIDYHLTFAKSMWEPTKQVVQEVPAIVTKLAGLLGIITI